MALVTYIYHISEFLTFSSHIWYHSIPLIELSKNNTDFVPKTNFFDELWPFENKSFWFFGHLTLSLIPTGNFLLQIRILRVRLPLMEHSLS